MMKLTDVILIWQELHPMNVNELGYCALERAIEKVVGIQNDVDGSQPDRPPAERKQK